MTLRAPPVSPSPWFPDGFAGRVRQEFGRQAAAYDGQAGLQRAMAWRLARICRDLPLTDGPRADLGAGSGLLSLALLHHCESLGGQAPLQIDLCPELLARNPLLRSGGPAQVWDLNGGLPPELAGSALLSSSFALQWLDSPAEQLALWCDALAPHGWLALAVPTAGSFPEWQRAARAARVPYTGLEFPTAGELIGAVLPRGLILLPGEAAALQPSRPGGPGGPAPPAQPGGHDQPPAASGGRPTAAVAGPLARGDPPQLGGAGARGEEGLMQLVVAARTPMWARRW